MNLESWDPFQRLADFRRRSSETLDELLAHLSEPDDRNESIAFQPEVDLVETATEYRLYLSIPGMIEDDLMIDVTDRYLTVRGERQPPYDVEKRTADIREWRYGFFERQFELSTSISVRSIRAAYDAGVLTIIALKSSFDTPLSDLDRFSHEDSDDRTKP